jgi:hypothetical protein
MIRDRASSVFDWLRTEGLLNVDAGPLSDLISSPKDAVARCYSSECAGANPQKFAVIEEAVGTFCPRCGHALVWKRGKRVFHRDPD